jgi:Carboxypeptidase regulatory-like domain
MFAVLILLLTFAVQAYPQIQTGTITGRATDGSGALIPGVEVTITSPAMIGGARSAPTDETGTYRFTQLSPGVYRVTFALPGFATLNIESVTLLASSTMTINGVMTVASVAEEVTVTSQAPTIDLEAATVGVNWSQKNMDNLPWGRAVAALTRLIPGMYATTFDVGGNTMGGGTTLGGRLYGRSGGEVNSFDGVIWDMAFQDYSTYSEIQISTAAKGADQWNPGATVNMVFKSGGNDFHGTAYAAWEDGSFQSKNIDQKLLDRGLTPGKNRFSRYNDFSFDLGGRIIYNKLWFYASYGDSFTGQYLPGFVDQSTGEQQVYSTQLRIPTLKLTYQLTDKMKLETLGQFSKKSAPQRGGSETVPLEATENQQSLSNIGPTLKWTYIMNPRMTTDISVNRSGYWWPSYAHTTAVRRVDLTSPGQTRGAFSEVYRRPINWQTTGNWSWFTDIGGKGNEIKSGAISLWKKSYSFSFGYPNQQQYRYRSTAADTAGCTGVNCDYFLRPNSVIVYDNPSYSASIAYYTGWYVNDKVTVNRKLTVTGGIRFDRYASALPEQGNPGTGPFSTKNLYPTRHDFPVYNSWVPRFSLVYDVKGDGKLALKASYGRYRGAGGPGGTTVNPNSTTSCTYNKWDGSIPYVPIAANLAGACSGGSGIKTLDANLKSSYTDEYTGGIELGLKKNYLVRLNFVRKFDYGGTKALNLNQPFEAYTDVAQGIDPGRDNKVGTADDGVMYAYSISRSYPTFATTNTLTTNLLPGEGRKQYSAIETTFNKQAADNWSFLATYTADFADQGNNIPLTPNALLYNWQIPIWRYGLRLSGTWDAPYGLKWGSTYDAQSGAPFTRSAQMTNALGSTVTVVVEGLAGYYDWVKLWDNRVSKVFKVGDRQSVEAMFDLYNSFNSNTVLSQTNTNGANYLKPTQGSGFASSPILPPRIFKLGMRWKF